MAMQHVLVALCILLAVFTQTVSGFGLALVSMPLLAGLLGLRVATPLVALIGVAIELVLLLRFRAALQVRVVWRLIVASLASMPVGIWALRHVQERVILGLLGILVIAYAVYGLLDRRLPLLAHPAWAYGLGCLSGILGGAYNLSGPPVVVYGHCRGWPPLTFKANLQGFFLVLSMGVLAGHALSGNLTTAVWQNLPPALIGAAAGIVLGLRLGDRIHPSLFRRLVLGLLVVLGMSLVL